jgi:Chromo (CHRromatin Organisation MOdifier) domain
MIEKARALDKAKATLELAAEKMKWYYDKAVQRVPYKVGDKVLLDLRDYQKSGRKLAAKYYGPFTIIEKLSPVTFKVEWPERLVRMHPVFHASKLVPYSESKIPGQIPTHAPPELIDGHEEWEIEEILVSRRRYRKLEYLVHWKGFTADQDTWEPAKNLKNAPLKIEEFYQKHPNAVRAISEEVFVLTKAKQTWTNPRKI